MPTVIEPISAGLVVDLINKLIIKNHNLWLNIGGYGHPNHEESHEDGNSTTTSINDVEVHVHLLNIFCKT